MYVKQREFNGMGQFGGQFGASSCASPEDCDTAAARAERAAASYRAEGGKEKEALNQDALAEDARAKAASLRADRASSDITKKALFDLTGTLLTVGGNVGQQMLTNQQQIALMRAQAKMAQAQAQVPGGGGGPSVQYVTQPSAGLSTGAMIGIGVGVLALVGVLVMTMGKK